MMKQSIFALCLGVAAVATGAQAATIDLTGDVLNSDDQGSQAGFDFTVYAGAYDDNADFNLFDWSTWPTNQDEDAIIAVDCSGTSDCNGRVTENGDGLGVSNWRRDNREVDGAFGDDLITIVFSGEVIFEEVMFSNFGSRDSFDFFIDGVLVAPEERTGPNPFPIGLTGTSISFGADAWNDSYRLASISVSAVPLPATAALLLAGLGGLAAARRRTA